MTTRATLDRPAFLPGELVLLALTGVVALAAFLTGQIKGQAVDWMAFAPPVLGGLGLILMGAWARAMRGMERLALLLIGTSIYLTFGAFAAIFIFMFYPLSIPPIDAHLMQVDSLVGYNWAVTTEWVARWPLGGKILGVIYNSSLAQLLFLIALLAMVRREADLHRFILTGALALLGTLGIWTLAPSFGPAAVMSVSPATEQAINLVVDAEYGAKLMQMATYGIDIITPDTIIGSIAFPSYHTVMMMLVIWYARKTALALPILILNVPMVPAILVHGAHHAIDVAGGVAIFAVAAVISAKVINPAAKSPVFQRRSPRAMG